MLSLDLGKSSLEGRRILVTGGSRGIGRALVAAFLDDGAKVATGARHETGLDPLRQRGALTQTMDVADPESVKSLLEKIQDRWGGLDAVVNNAGILREGRLVEQPIEEWTETIEMHLGGPFVVIRAALEMMKGGSIVNITSGLARFPMEPYGAYCVSKAGLNMLTRAFALELGRKFRVNAVDPGVARTRMNPTAPTPPEAVVPVVRALVALDESGPTGRCFKKDGSEVEWGE